MLSTSPGQRVCVAYWTPVLGPKRALFVLPALGVPISEVGPSGVFDVGAHSAERAAAFPTSSGKSID